MNAKVNWYLKEADPAPTPWHGAFTLRINNDDPVSSLVPSKDRSFQDGGNSGGLALEGVIALNQTDALHAGYSGAVFTDHLNLETRRSTDERTSVAEQAISVGYSRVENASHRWIGGRLTHSDSTPNGLPQSVQWQAHNVTGGRRAEEIFDAPNAAQRLNVAVDVAERWQLGNPKAGFQPFIQGAATLGTAEQVVAAGVGFSRGNHDLPRQVQLANFEREGPTVFNPSGEWKGGDAYWSASANINAVPNSGTIFGAPEKDVNWQVATEGAIALSKSVALHAKASYGSNPVDRAELGDFAPDAPNSAASASVGATIRF